MDIRINRRLNAVFKVEREDGATIYVHHIPVPEEVFETNWRLLTKAVTLMYTDVFTPAVAARIGYRMIRELAQSMKLDEGTVDTGFFGHVWRLTTLILPEQAAPVPLDVAVSGNMLDSELLSEVRNAICFFTAASWVHPRSELRTLYGMLEGESRDSNWSTGSWSCTEYAASLKTSTPAVNTGVTTPGLSVPH